jgi:hypothetical protein
MTKNFFPLFSFKRLGVQIYETKALTTLFSIRNTSLLCTFSTFYLTMNRNDPSHAWHGSLSSPYGITGEGASLMTTTQLVLSNSRVGDSSYEGAYPFPGHQHSSELFLLIFGRY